MIGDGVVHSVRELAQGDAEGRVLGAFRERRDLGRDRGRRDPPGGQDRFA
jgi:hypothetical protein